MESTDRKRLCVGGGGFEKGFGEYIFLLDEGNWRVVRAVVSLKKFFQLLRYPSFLFLAFAQALLFENQFLKREVPSYPNKPKISSLH